MGLALIVFIPISALIIFFLESNILVCWWLTKDKGTILENSRRWINCSDYLHDHFMEVRFILNVQVVK